MKKVVIGISLLIALSLVLLTVVMTTGAGLRLAARLILPVVPGQLSYATLEGRVTGPLQASQLRWEDEDRVLTIDNLDIDFNPAALLSRHVDIVYLRANGVRWQAPVSAETPPSNEKFSLPALPVAVSVGALQIDDIVITQGASTVPLKTLRLAARLDNERYSLESLRIESEQLDASGTATIEVRSPHSLEADLRWTVRLAGQDTPIAGTTTANGNTDSADLRLTATGPFALTISGTATKLLDDPSLVGQLDLKQLDPALAGLDLQTGKLDALLDYTLSTQSVSVAGRIEAQAWPDAAIVETTLGLNDDVIEIDQLRLKVDNLATTVSATGNLRTDLSDMDIDLAWTEITWPLRDKPQFSSPTGTARLTGSKDDYSLQLNAQLDEAALPAARLDLRGSGSTTRFNIAGLTAVFTEGQLTGRGTLDWQDLPKADLSLSAQDLALDQWHDKLEGRLGFDSTLTASLPADGARIAVEIQKARGKLRDQMLTGRGSFNYAPGLLRLTSVDIRAGAARVEANGQVGEQVDLSWELSVPNIALLLPGSTGQIRSQGKARGQRGNAGLIGDLQMKNVRVGQFSARQINSDFDIGVSAGAKAHVELRGTGLEIASIALASLSADTDGTVAQQTTTIELAGPLGKLTTSLRGGIDANRWQGEVTRLTAERQDIGQWQLTEPAALTLAREAVDLQQICVKQDEAQLCARGDYATNRPWRSDFSLAQLPVQLLAPLLPPDLSYDGFISGNGHVAAADADWAGAARLQFSDGQVLTRENNDDNILIAYRNGVVDASFTPAYMQAKMGLDLRDAGEFDADITIPLESGRELSGTVTARVENLSIVTALLPQVGRIDGRLTANLMLAGTANAPDLSGKIALDTTELVLPDFGITLKDTAVNVETTGNDLRFDGKGQSGDGSITLSGELQWQQGSPQGELKMAGENFRAVDLPEIRLDASPDVTLTVNGRNINVTGEITVPAAQITPIDIGTGSTVSSDQVIVGQAAETADQQPWQINASMQVTAGDAVHIRGFGLEGKLTGSVLVIEAPNQPTVGRGTLEVKDGRYRAYGQELTIETGRLAFTGGPIDDPGINLLATRTAGEVVAGARVRGALRAPELTLYSVPSMSDTQTMSYLITGRGLEDLNELDQTLVSDTATRLALQGGSVLASSLGREIGLDSVEFEDSGETASTSLVVGKNLSPRLFVSYGIGLFESINTLRLRYRINSRLTLETQSGPRTSADLLYSIER